MIPSPNTFKIFWGEGGTNLIKISNMIPLHTFSYLAKVLSTYTELCDVMAFRLSSEQGSSLGYIPADTDLGILTTVFLLNF